MRVVLSSNAVPFFEKRPKDWQKKDEPLLGTIIFTVVLLAMVRDSNSKTAGCHLCVNRPLDPDAYDKEMRVLTWGLRTWCNPSVSREL